MLFTYLLESEVLGWLGKATGDLVWYLCLFSGPCMYSAFLW